MWLERLRQMKEDSGLTIREIAERSGLPEPTLEKLFAGSTRDPRLGTVSRLVRFFGFTLNDLEDMEEELGWDAKQVARAYGKLPPHGQGAVKALLDYEVDSAEALPEPLPLPKARRNGHGIVELRVFEEAAAAGLGNYLTQPQSHLEQYPEGVVPEGADFGVLISGDSMEPRLHSGGTAFVKAAPSIEPGQIGIFSLNGEAYCKKLVVDQEQGQVRLRSLNPAYRDIVLVREDVLVTFGQVLGQYTPGYGV